MISVEALLSDAKRTTTFEQFGATVIGTSMGYGSLIGVSGLPELFSIAMMVAIRVSRRKCALGGDREAELQHVAELDRVRPAGALTARGTE